MLEGAFHGRTMGALSATPQPDKQEPFAPLVPGFTGRAARRSRARSLRRCGDGTAAVMLEPIQGETGIWPISERMLLAAREACDRSGALLIFDEIQCGMGRTGTLWAFELTPVRPDVLTTAKALASGLPVARVHRRPARRRTCCEPGDHGATFGGGPLVAAAALATLDDARRRRAAVARARARRPPARGARGAALRRPADRRAGARADARPPTCLPSCEGGAPAVVARALEQGIVLNATGPLTLRFLPPLVVDGARRRPRARVPAGGAVSASERRRARSRPPPTRRSPDEVGRVLLLYSGGLDTSVMLKWIQDQYGAEIVALTVDLGQPGEDFERRARQGAAAGRARLPGGRREGGVRARLRAAGDQGERALRRRLSAVHGARPAADREAGRREGARDRLRHDRPRLHGQGQRPGADRGDRRGARPGA